MHRYGVSLVFLAFAGLTSLAAQAALLAPKHDTIHSAVLGQERAIEVSLPEESAKDPAQRFETLYVLDGDWNAKLVIEVADFLRQLGMIPPIIVVSVPNFIDPQGVNSRDHDLTPSSKPNNEPHSGGAAQFLTFLKTELVPYMDQHYPTNSVRLIHGHSYGGLFLVYALEHEPQLFDGYLVLDPALWWDKPWLQGEVADALKRLAPAGKALFVAGRSGDEFKGMGIDVYEAVLKSSAPAGLPWRVTPYEDETHDSLKLKATYEGLRFQFDGYTQDDPIVIHPQLGTVIPGRPLRLAVENSRLHLHYTTDGTEPTAQSPEYNTAVAFTDPSKLRFRAVTRRGDFEADVPPLGLVVGKPFAPLAAGAARKADAAWRYKLYKAGSGLPSPGGHPVASGTADTDLTLKVKNETTVSGRLERVIDIPSDGYYVLWVSADQSQLVLNGKVLFTTDEAKHQRSRTYLAPLERGRYTLAVDFRQGDPHSGVDLGVLPVTDEAPEWWKKEPAIHLHAR